MVHIENLKIGDYVTPVEDHWEQDSENPFRQKTVFDGRPYMVIAISFPFVAIENGGKVISIDVRRFGLTKLNKQYAQATLGATGGKVPTGRRKKIKTKRDPRDCIRCGERMVQRIPKDNNPGRLWHRVCPTCGFDHGPVEVG